MNEAARCCSFCSAFNCCRDLPVSKMYFNNTEANYLSLIRLYSFQITYMMIQPLMNRIFSRESNCKNAAIIFLCASKNWTFLVFSRYCVNRAFRHSSIYDDHLKSIYSRISEWSENYDDRVNSKVFKGKSSIVNTSHLAITTRYCVRSWINGGLFCKLISL